MSTLKIFDPTFLPHASVDIELMLNPGEGIVLTGENGLGKTTLLEKIYETNLETKVLIQQKMLDHFYDRTLKKTKEIFFEARSINIQSKLFCELWIGLGLAGKEDRKISHLSGGESQSLKICFGLVQNSSLYFLDEPSQFLDSSKKIFLINILDKLRTQRKTIVMVEHDLDWISPNWQIQQLSIQNKCLKKVTQWST
jgi:manganese/zinc/iron transport system ATP- binding protein